MGSVQVIEHPILKRDVPVLRWTDTPYGLFRSTIRDISSILAYEVLRTRRVRTVEVQTPIELTEGHEVDEEVIVVTIMRSVLVMIDGFVNYLPDARFAHRGMSRE